MAYLVVRWVNGSPYLYLQKCFRSGGDVRTKTLDYYGRASSKDVAAHCNYTKAPPRTLEEDKSKISARLTKRIKKHDYIHATTLKKLSLQKWIDKPARKYLKQLSKNKQAVYQSSDVLAKLNSEQEQ
jgi:hypothetical protein